MDNVVLKKKWEDEECIELSIISQSQYVIVNQNCYISKEALAGNSEMIRSYIEGTNEKTYISFGNKEGNYTPAFSMEIMPPNDYGHITIEMDMEIDDNTTRSHRCKFFVRTEMGLLEEFGKGLYSVCNESCGTTLELNRKDA